MTTTDQLLSAVKRSPFAVEGWLAAAAEHGIDPERLLEGSGLDRGDLTSFDTLVEPSQELTVIRRLVAALPGQPGIGVIAGLSCTVGSLGPFALACVSLETFGAAIHHSVRLLGLTFAFVRPRLSWEESDLVMTMEAGHVDSEIRDAVIERDLTAFLQIADVVVAELGGISIDTTLGHDSIIALRRVSHGIPISPGRKDAIRFAARVLERRTRQANPGAAANWLSRAESDLRNRRAGETTASRVRTAVAHQLENAPPAAEIAKSLGMDERTLRRRLSGEGTSYRTIVDEARKRLALDLLTSSTVTVAQIARRVGYNDAAAFGAAFKRWHGESPGRYRRRSKRG
ncbi:helix-turn-helix domain-containing protein [Nocardia asteroides]|uniref:AraC family transcriptional regulator n=1 Tax=Nocardia asteroides TaxID=1824 RepID=UPI0037C8AD47